jgi:hypothetical protein
MARIRSIKPEFPQSESMGRVSRDARLLFVMLWPICDDHGRTRAASRMLASLLFPYDADAPALMDGWLAELEREGCIRRYVVDGSTYLEVCNWLKHQKIDKPSKPQFPEFSGTLASPREDSRTFVVGKEGKGKDQDQERMSSDKPTTHDARLAEVTDDAMTAYNATLAEPLSLPKAMPVGIDKKRGYVRRSLKTIREVCRAAYGSEIIVPEFWADYFAALAADDFIAGRTGRPKEHANWRPDFEYVTRPEVIAKAFERAAA